MRIKLIGAALAAAAIVAGPGAVSGKAATQIQDTACGAGLREPPDGGCTHGYDSLPVGLDLLPGGPPTGEVVCDGDGTSGKRIQAIYVGTTARDRYAELRPSFSRWAAEADGIFAASAAETKGTRHIRFVTEPAPGGGCELDVLHVTVPAEWAEIAWRAYVPRPDDERADRKYLVWVDVDSVYCGLGSVIDDDRPGPENEANLGGHFAEVYPRCFDKGGFLEAHELTHTLGGVQSSAPHALRGHCSDDHDVMCYGSPDEVHEVCPESHERLLDCNHDDYFHTNPLPGTYLATHWNIANSRFLIGAETPRVPLP